MATTVLNGPADAFLVKEAFNADPPRPSTLEGATTYCPQAALRRLAERYNTSVSSLATLTVKPSAFLLYEAIVTYAPRSGASGPLPLMIRSVIEDEDEVEEEDQGELMAGSGLRSKKAPKPIIELGTSEFSFTWPPKNWNPKEKVEEGQPESFDVSLVHYSVGEAKGGMGEMKTYQEITMVCQTRALLVRFTHEVLEWSHSLRKEKIAPQSFQFYRFRAECESGYWDFEGTKRGRKVDSVILKEGQIESLLSDVERFMSAESREFYLEHGVPHRRSYLLYGPPGTGKTSTIRVIAGRYGLNCCYLSLVHKDFSNQMLGDALRKIPSNALIVLEDVDALFKGRTSQTANSLTFSGLLNALDGLLSAEGTLVIMTTNYLDKLDPALIRGGRVDCTFKFDLPDDVQLAKLFKSFYPNSDDETAMKFVGKVRARKENQASSVATLQQLFIDCREKEPQDTVDEVDKFFDRHIPDDERK